MRILFNDFLVDGRKLLEYFQTPTLFLKKVHHGGLAQIKNGEIKITFFTFCSKRPNIPFNGC